MCTLVLKLPAIGFSTKIVQIFCECVASRRSRHSFRLLEFFRTCGYVHILFAIDLDATSEIKQLRQTKHHTIANGTFLSYFIVFFDILNGRYFNYLFAFLLTDSVCNISCTFRPWFCYTRTRMWLSKDAVAPWCDPKSLHDSTIFRFLLESIWQSIEKATNRLTKIATCCFLIIFCIIVLK